MIEIIDGPRKGKVVTSSQVKFRETHFPLHSDLKRSASQPDPTDRLWISVPTLDGDCDHDDSNNDDDGGDGSDDDGDTDYDSSLMQGDVSGEEEDDDDDEPAPASTRATCSETGPLDYVQTFSAFDAALKNGTVILQTLAKDSPKDPQDKDVPRSFNHINSINDVEQRNSWYRTYYAEFDGLLENPDVLAMVPKPDSISESEVHYIHTIFSPRRTTAARRRATS